MKKKIGFLGFTTALFVMSSILFGVCVPEAVSAEKQYGGIFKLILYSRPGTPIGWPPEMSYRDVTVSQVPLESLLRLRYDLTTEPMLAKSWDIAPDMRSITFHLRKGVKFHDGTDFNAKAAKFNLDGLMSAKKGGTQAWTSIDIIDDYTIKVSLGRWDNTMVASIGTAQMVSPTAFKTMGLEKIRWHPVGTGPYKFVSHVHDVGTKFTRFNDYWKGKPYLDGLEIQYIADPMTQKAKMLAGEADANWSPNIKVGSDLKAAGFNVLYNHDGIFHLTPASSNTPALADKRVRMAMEHAINKEAIMKALGYGFWEPAYQIAVPKMGVYLSNVKGRHYDPDKAKALLKEAGYQKGFKTKIIVFPGTSKEIMAGIQGYLAEVGITADIDYPVMGRFMGYRRNGWKDAMTGGPWALYPNMGRTFYTYLTTTCGDYVSLTRPDGMDGLVNDALSTSEPDISKMQKVLQKVYDDVTTVTLFYIGSCRSLKKTVHDTGFFEYSGKDYWTPEKVWLSK